MDHDRGLQRAAVLALPRHPNYPFASAPTRDSCSIFVSGTGGDGGKPGITVLRRAPGRVELVRMVPLQPAGGTGMALTHDGQVLVLAANVLVAFFDVASPHFRPGPLPGKHQGCPVPGKRPRAQRLRKTQKTPGRWVSFGRSVRPRASKTQAYCGSVSYWN